MKYLDRKGTSKHLKLDALVLVAFVLAIIFGLFSSDVGNLLTGAFTGISIMEDQENYSLQEISIGDERLYQPNKQVWKVKNNSEDFYFEMIDDDTFRYKVKPGSKDKENKKTKLKKTKLKGGFDFKNGNQKVNLNGDSGTFDLDLDKKGRDKFNKTDKFKLGNDSVLFEYEDTNELIFNFTEGNVSIIPYYLIEGELYTIPAAQVEMRVLDNSFKFGYDITVNNATEEIGDLDQIVLKYVSNNEGAEFIQDGDYGFYINRTCEFVDYFSEITPLTRNISCDLVFDGSDIVKSKFENSSYSLTLNVSDNETLIYIDNNWSLVDNGEVIIIDPTITETYSSAPGGTYNDTKWDSGESVVGLNSDAVYIVKFDDNVSKIYDLSVNGNDVDTTAPSVGASCKYGDVCLNFDGTNDEIKTDELILNSSHSWAISFWADFDGSGTEGMVLGDDTLSDAFIWLYSGNYLAFRNNNVTNTEAQFTHNLSDFAGMTHYVLNTNGTNLSLYLNGTFVQNVSQYPAWLTINNIGYPYTSGDFFFNGVIECVQVFNSSVNADTGPSTLYASGTCNETIFTAFGNTAIATWRLDNYTKNQTSISSGKYDGDAGAFYTTEGSLGSGAFEFDGVNDFIDAGDPYPNAQEFSVSLWAYRKGPATPSKNIFEHRWGSEGIEILCGTKCYLYFGNGTLYTLSEDIITIDKWTHYAFTYDLDTRTGIMYKNGTQIENITNSGYIHQTTKNLFIGSDVGGTSNWNGSIDTFNIFNRTLSPAEVLSLYNGTSSNHSYIPKYKTPGDYVTNSFDAGSPANWTSITLNGSFDNDTIVDRDLSNITHWWTFDNNTDDLNTTLNGVASGAKYDIGGRGINGSYYFDGVDDYVNLSGFNFNDYNYSVWVLEVDNGSWSFFANISGEAYVNGELSNFTTPLYYDGTDTLIGKNSSSTYFKGFLDEVKMYNMTLTANGILEEYRRSRGGKVEVEFRTSSDNSTWSAWYANPAPNLQTGLLTLNSTIPDDRYGEVRLIYSVVDEEVTGGVSGLDVGYNTTPVMNTSRISPTTVYTNDTLLGYCNATDGDGNNLIYYYQWYLNDTFNLTGNVSSFTQGVETNVNNVSSTNLTKDQNWTLSCLAGDGGLNSSWLNGSSVMILNTAPEARSVNLSSNDEQNRTNGTLNGTWAFFDLDSSVDSQTDNETKWFNNSVEATALINLTSVASANTTKNQNWTFSVRVHDGTAWSAWVNSSNLTIVNAAPDFDEDLVARTAYSDQAFGYDVNCSDIDSDTITYYDNTSLFNITSNNGLINDTPNQTEAGAHVVNVTCDDGTTNKSQTFTYTVNDLTLATITIGSPVGSTNDASPDLNVTTDEAVNCSYKNTSITYTAMKTTGGTTHSQNLSTLAVGEHTYFVQCNDSSGNLANKTIPFTISSSAATQTNTTNVTTATNQTITLVPLKPINITFNISRTINTTISAAEFDTTPETTALAVTNYTVKTHKYYSINAEDEFKDNINSLSIVFTYNETELDSAGLIEGGLVVYYYNSSSEGWQEENYTLNTTLNYLNFTPNHLSTFFLGTLTFGSSDKQVGGPPSTGGGGGGGSSSSTPSEFSERFDFIEKDTLVSIKKPTLEGIDKISFEVTEDLTNDWLKIDKVVFAPKEFKQTIYTLFQIRSGKIKDNLKTASIYYSVDKAWLDKQGLGRAGVALFRLDNSTWKEVPRSFVGMDNDRFYYLAITDKFSYFVIGEREKKEYLKELTEIIKEEEREEEKPILEEVEKPEEPSIEEPSVWLGYKAKIDLIWEKILSKVKPLFNQTSTILGKAFSDKVKPTFKSYKLYLIMWSGILVLAILVISLTIRSKRKIPLATRKKKITSKKPRRSRIKEMLGRLRLRKKPGEDWAQSLARFITTCKKRGLSKEEIEELLLEKGWPKELVEEYIKEVFS